MTTGTAQEDVSDAAPGEFDFDTSHFDEIEGEVVSYSDDEPPEPGLMTKQQFRQSFGGLFNMGGQLTGLESLTIKPAEQPSADACADTIYDMALEIEWMKSLLKPSSPWIGRALVVGMFTIPKAGAAIGELKARKMARIQQARAKQGGAIPQPANGNDPTAWINTEGRAA